MRYFGPVICVMILLGWSLSGTIAAESDLELKYSVKLEEKDRILGDLTGNFLIYGRPYIKMYDHDGNRLFSRRLKNNVKPVLSPAGKYLALVTYADHSPTELKTIKLELYNPKGERLLKIDKPAATLFELSDKGWFIGVEGVAGIAPNRVHIYDPSGKDIKTLIFQTFRKAVFAPAGDHIVVDKGSEGLELFDLQGNSVSSVPVCRNYLLSRDARYWACFGGGIFNLYQGDSLVKNLQVTPAEIIDMAFDIQSNLLVILAEKRLRLLDLVDGKLRWEYRLNEPEQYFTALSLSPDGRHVACGMDINRGDSIPKAERHIEGEALLFPVEGASPTRHSEKYTLWDIGLPRVALTASQNSLIIMTKEKVARYSYR